MLSKNKPKGLVGITGEYGWGYGSHGMRGEGKGDNKGRRRGERWRRGVAEGKR